MVIFTSAVGCRATGRASKLSLWLASLDYVNQTRQRHSFQEDYFEEAHQEIKTP
jgi:hypothetical protein